MTTAICLGDILHISLGQGAKCFGESKTYRGTKPCETNLGQKRLSDARYILIQTLAQLERDNQTIEQHLVNLSDLLVHPLAHKEAGKERKRKLQSKWKALVEEYRTAQNQNQLIVRSEDQTNQSVLSSTTTTSAAPISTPTPAALALTPPIIHTDHDDTIPDPTPDSDLHIHTTSVGQEDNRRGPQALHPMPELPCDRTSSNPACLPVGRQSLSAGDVSFEYIWILLVQICFGRHWQSQQGTSCSWMPASMHLNKNKIFSTEGLLKDYAVEMRFFVAARFSLSLMELARSLIWGISFYYGVLVLVPGLLHVFLSNYLFIGTLCIVFVAGWGSGQSVRYPVTVRQGYGDH